MRASFFARGAIALCQLFGGERAAFLDGWDVGRVWSERRRIEKNAELQPEPARALAHLAEIACDPTLSTLPDERLASCLRAIVNCARSGEPAVLEFPNCEFLLRGAFGIDVPLSVMLLGAALVPPALVPSLAFQSWCHERTPELAPGQRAFGLAAVAESGGVPKRVLPGARFIRADGSTDRPFPDDGVGRLVTTAVAAIREARNVAPEEREERLRILRVLATHLASDNPAVAAAWRAGRRSVPAAAIEAAIRAACEASEPAEAVRLLEARDFEPAREGGAIEQLIVAAIDDADVGRYLDRLLRGLQAIDRYDLLGQLCEAAARVPALEGPILGWLAAQEELSRVLDLVAGSGAVETLRAAPCDSCRTAIARSRRWCGSPASPRRGYASCGTMPRRGRRASF